MRRTTRTAGRRHGVEPTPRIWTYWICFTVAGNEELLPQAKSASLWTLLDSLQHSMVAAGAERMTVTFEPDLDSGCVVEFQKGEEEYAYFYVKWLTAPAHITDPIQDMDAPPPPDLDDPPGPGSPGKWPPAWDWPPRV